MLQTQLHLTFPDFLCLSPLKACENIEFKKGQSIIKQGESGAEFFVIKKGEASPHPHLLSCMKALGKYN